MKFIADLHIHSKYSRATAKNLDFENLYYFAQIKGISVVGTGDFTYPDWISEIEEKLEETEPGLYSLKKDIANEIDNRVPNLCRRPVRFILQTEISNIYKKEGRVRKNHNLIYFPDILSVKKFAAKLDTMGNIASDGRPILGLDARDLLEMMLDTNPEGFFVPAHIWTPWFSLFGSKSGFDSMEECFGDLKNEIFSVETGLSSDPPMNWRVKDLDNVRLISNSDAHSPGYLGRNASVFNTELSFSNIRKALEKNDLHHYLGTLDMHPHQGKYHYDGHRKCGVSLNPSTTQKINGICPECGSKVTYGVLNRVQKLASRPEGYLPENRHGYQSIIPLTDIFSEIFKVGPKTKKVTGYYEKAVRKLGSEIEILLERSINDIEKANIPFLAAAVRKMRDGNIHIDPGYDGEFGKVQIFSKEEKLELSGQKYVLFNLPSKKNRKNKKKASEIPAIKIKKIKAIPLKSLRKKEGSILDGLNSEQQEAVDETARAIVIQAGPGTGKTRALTARIARLISRDNIAPGAILALTFTNKAAQQLEEKTGAFLNDSKEKVFAATYHAFCMKLLKQYSGFDRLLSDDDLRQSLIRQAIQESSAKMNVSTVDRYISLCKQQLLSAEDDLTGVVSQKDTNSFKRVFKRYLSLCETLGIADFEDLIGMTVAMLEHQDILSKVKEAFPYIFIDEYQDLNYAQYVLTKMIAKKQSIFVIGDPDQSIYGFRGSDNKYFKRFGQDFDDCRKIRFVKNYRSSQTILDASFQMISTENTYSDRLKIYSQIKGNRKLIIKETASEIAEAVAIGKMIEKLVGGTSFYSMDTGKGGDGSSQEYAFSDFAILYRTKRQGDVFARIFEKEDIPFQKADRKSMFDHNAIYAIISMARIVSLKGCLNDFRRVVTYFDLALSAKQKNKVQTCYNSAVAQGKEWIHALYEMVLENTEEWMDTKERLERILKNLIHLMDELKNEKPGMILDKISQEILRNKTPAFDSHETAQFKILRERAGLYKTMDEFISGLCLEQDSDTLSFRAEKVSLMTIHAAKGLEFPVVFVAGCEQGLVPFAKDGEKIDDMDEERRLFYVAMTRAMDILCLTYTKKRRIYGRDLVRQRSFFINDIEKKLTQFEKEVMKPSEKTRETQLELF